MALSRFAKLYSRPSVSLLERSYHTGTIGEDNIIRGDKDLDIPVIDMFSFFKKRFQMHGEKVALIDTISGEKMTYTQLLSNSNKLASFFDKKGYKQGDCVGIHTPNCIEYPVGFFGSLAKGMVFTTANPAYTPHELNQQLKGSDSKILFTNSTLVDSARKAIENTNVNLLVSIDDTNINDSGVVHFCDILNSGDDNFEKDITIDPIEDVACLLYSSGTTGLPKGVMLTHHNLISNLFQLYDAGNDGNTFRDNIMCILPMYHVYGIFYINCVHMYHGAAVCTLPSFDPVTFLSAIQNYKIEKLPLVPPIALFLLNHPMVNDYDLSSVTNVTIGAAPVDENVTKAFVKKLPGAILTQGYGMTESLITHLQPTDVTSHRPGSAGFVVKNVDWKIACLETGKALGPNEKGEVCTKGPQVMKGYLNNPEATANCLTEDGWMHSGDLGYYDENGNIFVIDRLKELIKYKGMQVAPAELEDLLLSHDGIQDSCVIGIPDERAGEVPRAYVVKTADSSITEDDVIMFISERMSQHKHLRGGVKFIDTLPKSPSGKLLRRVLLQEYMEELA